MQLLLQIERDEELGRQQDRLSEQRSRSGDNNLQRRTRECLATIGLHIQRFNFTVEGFLPSETGIDWMDREIMTRLLQKSSGICQSAE